MVQRGDLVAVKSNDGYRLLEITATGPASGDYQTRYLGKVRDQSAAIQAVTNLAELEWVDAWVTAGTLREARAVALNRIAQRGDRPRYR
jgi:hypothetical protein